MIQLFVNDYFKEYQSYYFKTFDSSSEQSTESVIYLTFFLRIIIYFRINFVRN